MAKVTLTFTDNADGTLGLVLESDPPLPGPAAKDQTLTVAQDAAWYAMQEVVKALKSDDDEEDDSDCP